MPNSDLLAIDEENEREAAGRIMILPDLVKGAKQHLRLLKAVRQWPTLVCGLASQRASYRYEYMWLPLCDAVDRGVVKNNTDLPLTPPLDIHWIWHCHLLNPIAYGRDCYNVFGQVIDTPFCSLDNESFNAALESTRQFWLQEYPEEPFELDLQAYENPSTELEDEVSSLKTKLLAGSVREKISTDLLERCQLQSSFPYNVLEGHYEDTNFLKLAESRYRKFLLVKARFPNSFIVPTYDIDLIWHTHQRFPIAYANETLSLLGSILNHNEDSDRSANGKLSNGFQVTCELFRRLYGESYMRAGGMYRGKEPKEVIMSVVPSSDEWTEWMESAEWGLQQSSSIKVCVAVIGSRNLPRMPSSSVLCAKAQPIIDRESGLLFVSIPSRQVAAQHASTWLTAWHFECRLPACQGMRLNLVLIPAKEGLGRETVLGYVDVEFQKLPEGFLGKNEWIPLQVESAAPSKSILFAWRRLLAKQQTASLRCDWSITPPRPAPHLLRLCAVSDGQQCISVVDESDSVPFCLKILPRKKAGGDSWQEKVVVHSSNGGKSFEACLDATAASGRTLLSIARTEQWQLSFAVTAEESSSPVTVSSLSDSRRVPMALVEGRKLLYTVEDSNPEEEREFFTLVRFPNGERLGVASALVNWKRGAMEVHCEEDCTFVALACFALHRGMQEILSADSENSTAEREGWRKCYLTGSTARSQESDLSPWWIHARDLFEPLCVPKPLQVCTYCLP